MICDTANKFTFAKNSRAKKFVLEAGAGIEPAIKALQAPALPLCYPAKKERVNLGKRFQYTRMI